MSFPTTNAIVRLAVLAEQPDEWSEGSLYPGRDILAKSRLIDPEEATDTILELSD